MKRAIVLMLLFCLSFFVYGCSSVPLHVAKPWIRCLKSDQIPDPNRGIIKIEVEGQTTPLIGNEYLTSEKLRLNFTELMKRKGFIVDNSRYVNIAKLIYKTDISEKRTSFSTGSTLGAVTEGILSYTHTIAIEFFDKDGAIFWKGDAKWDSEELNLLNQTIPVLRLIVSKLPSAKTSPPEIQEIKLSHARNYFKLECQGMWFTCPALSSRIAFSYNSATTYAAPGAPDSSYLIPSCIKNLNALAAYVDLLQTAEYALPRGNESDWKYPLNELLWDHATIGGQYLLGAQKTPINILIKLIGQNFGYYIEECKIVSDKEFEQYNNKLKKWQEALASYYDMFK